MAVNRRRTQLWLRSEGRIAGTGIEEERYDEESNPELRTSNSVSCRLPHENPETWQALSSEVRVYKLSGIKER